MKLRRLLVIILTPFLLTACDFIDDIFNPKDGYIQAKIIAPENNNENGYYFVEEGPVQLTPYVSRDYKEITDTVMDKITWSSSNPDIATVDNNGLVTGYKEGRAVINMTYSKYATTLAMYYKIATQKIEVEKDITMGLDETHKLDFYIEPSNASYTYTEQDYRGVYKIKDDFTIEPQKIGSSELYIHYYAKSEEENRYKEYRKLVNISVKAETLKPYFMFDEKKSTSGSVSFAKNKYSTLDLDLVGLKAYSYDGKDISDQVTKTGEYHLDQVGTYTVKLAVESEGRNASFTLKVIVTEFEEKVIPGMNTANTCLDYTFNVTTNNNNNVFSSISFSATCTYKNCDALDGTVRAKIAITAVPVNGTSYVTTESPVQTIILSKKYYDNKTFTLNCPTFYMDENHGSYQMSTYKIEKTLTFVGTAYEHVSY